MQRISYAQIDTLTAGQPQPMLIAISQAALMINSSEGRIRDLAAAIAHDMARLAEDLDAGYHLSTVGSRPADLDRAIIERDGAWQMLAALCGNDISERLAAMSA